MKKILVDISYHILDTKNIFDLKIRQSVPDNVEKRRINRVHRLVSKPF